MNRNGEFIKVKNCLRDNIANEPLLDKNYWSNPNDINSQLYFMSLTNLLNDKNHPKSSNISET